MISVPRLTEILRNVIRSSRTIHDVAALAQLRPLMKNHIPVSPMAMNPAEILRICNDVIINRRSCIVELGSGASTAYIARTMPEGSRLFSVDHDENWIAIVRSWLEGEGLQDRVTFIHAPLSSITTGEYSGNWYCQKALSSHLTGTAVDCLIVDGPPAGEHVNSSLARYPAVPVLKQYFGEKFSIYLDDAVREGEQSIAEKWGKELGVSFQNHLDTGGYAVASRGQAYMA